MLLAVFAGTFIGIFYVWSEWSWNGFLSGIISGIVFALTFCVLTVVLKLSKNGCLLYLHCAVSGLVGGFAWCLVARTNTIIIPVAIGTIGAPLAMWLETRNWKRKTA
jgi:ABC-type uncharacterized transport system permease subunit